MTLNEYQQEAMSLLNREIPADEVFLNAAMGMCGEAGEVIDLIKKHRFQGHGLDREKLVREVGDVLWYIAEAAEGLGVSMEEIAQQNLDKLHKRYPDGFSSANSMHRSES